MEESMKEYVIKLSRHKIRSICDFHFEMLELCKPDGLTGYMTPFVWMFISSYEKVRKGIINNHFINNLIQLEYSGFDGSNCTYLHFHIYGMLLLKCKRQLY